MNLKIKITSILGFLVLLFLINGVLFFFTPDIVHSFSIFKYVKYFIFLLFLGITVNDMLVHRVIFLVFIIPLGYYYFIINSSADLINFVNYVLPFFVLLSMNTLVKLNWKKIVLYTIWISYLFGLIEVFFLDNHFYMYNRELNSYRAVSIFLNPNNFGIVLAILTYCYVTYLSKNGYLNNIILFGSFLFIKFSGSKTALIVYGFYILYLGIKYVVKNKAFLYSFIKNLGLTTLMVVIGTSVLTITIVILKIQNQISFRQFDLQTLMIRFSAYLDFFVVSDGNILFPWYSSQSYVDNIYLHIYGSFGLLGLLSFLTLNLYILFMGKKNANDFVLLLSFLLVGITTNFLYVWPLSYMYWGLVGFQLQRKKTPKQVYNSINAI